MTIIDRQGAAEPRDRRAAAPEPLALVLAPEPDGAGLSVVEAFGDAAGRGFAGLALAGLGRALGRPELEDAARSALREGETRLLPAADGRPELTLLPQGRRLLLVLRPRPEDAAQAARAEAAEARARAAASELCAMMRNAPAGFYRFAQDGEGARLPYVSPGLCDLLGLPDARALASLEPIVERVHPEDRSGFLASIGRSLEKGAPWRRTFRVLHPGRGERWLDAVATPDRAGRDGASVYYGYVVDATAFVEARRRAEAASAAKGAFLATMSHEIRTPLNGVLGMAELLSREVTTEAQRRMAEVIRASGRSLLAILNDVLDMSRLEGGRVEMEAAPFDLRALVASVEGLFRPAALERRTTLRAVIEPGLDAPLVGDAHRIAQVLNNLVGNAVKFTEGGTVTLTVRKGDDDRVIFEVRDTGIGMSPEQVARAFDSFMQADASINRRYGGSGLGLSIAKGLVDAMGGGIALDSRLGEGATFRVTLPLPPAADAAQAAA